MQGALSHDENDIKQKYVTKEVPFNDGIRKYFKNDDAFYINDYGEKNFEEYVNFMGIQ